MTALRHTGHLAAKLNIVPPSMMLSRLLQVVTAGRRPNVVQLFRRASRYRDDGRFEEAADLVASGLRVEPDSAVGHLLAGSLHAVFREMHLARASFERVLALDPTHPRALLGMARIALEEGDRTASAGYLQRALERYPDFPEATALLDVVTSLEALPAPALTSVVSVRLDRLRAPSECRELLVARADGALLAAQPRGPRIQEATARLTRVCRLGGAMLERARLGGLKHAVLERAEETRFVRTDGTALLSLLLPREPDVTPGLVHLERVWANCTAELQDGVT
jgi:tetratricopeptide (TPR) repeat protein